MATRSAPKRRRAVGVEADYHGTAAGGGELGMRWIRRTPNTAEWTVGVLLVLLSRRSPINWRTDPASFAGDARVTGPKTAVGSRVLLVPSKPQLIKDREGLANI